MRIKICGLKRECDVEFVNEAKPDFAGFVFAESKRQVTVKQAKVLIDKLDREILSVGVFVNEEIEKICSVWKECGIDLIQLHGTETPEDVSRLKQVCKGKIIKVLRTGGEEAGQVSRFEAAGVDFFLFDHVVPGSGKTFDWEKLPVTKCPFFLAGGLGVNNVEEAIAKTMPYGVDLSSAVETEGVKNREKILEIVRLVHGIIAEENSQGK